MGCMAVHQISRADLKVGQQVEQAEHPWAGPRTARKIAMDHLEKNPQAYSQGKAGKGCGEKENIVILNQTIKVKPTPAKKKPIPKVQAPAWQTWGQELL